MARRSSARLRGRNSSTPKRVSLSNDAPSTRVPKTLPAKLGSLHESDEMPGAFPQSASPPSRNATPVPSKRVKTSVSSSAGTTPPAAVVKAATTQLFPPVEEMHTPKPITAKALPEGRFLDFSQVGTHSEPPKPSSHLGIYHYTPSHTSRAEESLSSPKCQFTFRREQSLDLSPGAKRLMVEKREEAAQIREQMILGNAKEGDVGQKATRKIATPKSKKSRFSEAHQMEFQKMGSIAGHASAFRAAFKHASPWSGATQRQEGEQIEEMDGKKSLKRSPSKAELDRPGYDIGGLHHTPSKPTLTPHGFASANSLPSDELQEESSPAKRMKRTATEDVSLARPASDSDRSLPQTPTQKKTPQKQFSHAHLSSLASPTQASLARVASVRTKIPAPQFMRSSSKLSLLQHTDNTTNPSTSAYTSTPLLSRSPSKASLFCASGLKLNGPSDMTSPLLARSPVKPSHSKPSVDVEMSEASNSAQKAPLLARTPLKMSAADPAATLSTTYAKESSIPLLSQTPSKSPFIASQLSSYPTTAVQSSATSSLMTRLALLRSSPMKSILRSPQRRLYSDDPAKVAAGTHLATPPPPLSLKKKHNPSHDSAAAIETASVSAPAHKRVDFSSSTKARDEAASIEQDRKKGERQSRTTESRSSSNSPTPALPLPHPDNGTVHEVTYPSLSSTAARLPLSPEKRRQTALPRDFTFRAGEHGIVFSASPTAPPRTDGRRRMPTIRHVSSNAAVDDVKDVSGPGSAIANPGTAIKGPREGLAVGVLHLQGSRKRKFVFDNEDEDKENGGDKANVSAGALPLSTNNDDVISKILNPTTKSFTKDGDNEQGHETDQRPAKRVKGNPHKTADSAPTSPPKKPVTRRPTLGVKPRSGARAGAAGAADGDGACGPGLGSVPGGKRSSAAVVISRARLNALALPKHRRE